MADSCELIRLATPEVATLQPYQPGKSVAAIQRELGLDKVIKLASNENPIGPGKKAFNALRTFSAFSRYPDGDEHGLKLALARHHGVSPEQITLGNGSNEILELVSRSVTTARHEIIFSQHAFAVYPLIAQLIGAKAVVAPAKDWGHDVEAMQAAINQRTRVMFIANPNNPTGTWLDQHSLRSLIESAPEHMVVVMDEAYFDYVQEETYPDCSQWVDEFPNLLVTRTFSKAHGLAGLRIGYGISHKDLAELMHRVRQPFSVNSMALCAAEAALGDQEHITQSVILNQQGMHQLTEAFTAMGLAYLPSVGNFICVEVPDSGAALYAKLLRHGVIVRPIDIYGMPNYVRITIGLAEENERFISALSEVI